jgi:phosphopantetheinyl transferase
MRRFHVEEEDILFRDHTLGRDVSLADPDLMGFPVVPLTISMEILAEVAALLQPGKVLVGMRNIRAHSWLMLEEQGMTIQVSASLAAGQSGKVQVAIRELRPNNQGTGPVAVEGTVVFADEYAVSPPVGGFDLQQERPSSWLPEQLYRTGMFHGPSFQTVMSMNRFGTDGATATMETLPCQNLFRTLKTPRFLTDAVLLDGAGQVAAFWVKEKFGEGVDIFPYRLKALHMFAPPPEPGVHVECRVRPQMLGETQMTSDIDLVLPDGKLYARLEGWEDRCFHLPPNFLRLRISPLESQLSTPWDVPAEGTAAAGDFVCCRLDGFPQDFLETHGSIWFKVLAHLVLSRRERVIWTNLTAVFKRRREWLLGRCAAKDAVRLLVKKMLGVSLCPADVEILSDEYGAPVVEGKWKQDLGIAPVVSISHSHEVAVALAAMNRTDPVGIDVECLSQSKDGFERLAFSAPERELLNQRNRKGSSEEQQEWRLRFWCAKEAVAKAVGRGFSSGPLAIRVTDAEPDTGLVRAQLSEEALQEFPRFRETKFLARTGREGDYVFSAVLCCSRDQEGR